MKLLKAIIVVSLCGVIVAAISLYHHTAQRFGLQTEPSFCNISAKINCDTVNGSSFSMILGIPIASLAILFYLMFMFGAVVGLGRDLVAQKTLAGVLALSGLFGFLYSIYLFYISEFVIGSLCLLCIGLYLINIILFLCAWKLWPGGEDRRLVVGLRSFARFPLTLFDSVPRRASLAWVAVLVGAISFFASIAAPEYMLPFIVSKSQEDAQKLADKSVAEWQKQKQINIPVSNGGALERDYQLGSANSPVQIVEFSDYECPACRSFNPVIEQIVHAYGDKIHFVSKNFPLDRSCNPTIPKEMHRFACLAAYFARCAGEQGKFWQAHNILFGLDALEKGRSVDEVKAVFSKTGQAMGLDVAALTECIDSERPKAKIQSDIKDGVLAELDHTPSFWINGRQVEHQSQATLVTIIDSILASNK